MRAAKEARRMGFLDANANYPFLSILWTMLIIFLWVIWFWILITVFADLFRRHDISGWMKVVWMIFVIIFPYLGVFIYLVSQAGGMQERGQQRMLAAQQQLDTHIQDVAGSGAANEIDKAKKLLDDGTITPQEFDTLKRKALA
jgi:Phospholipase_D-nuclease N-terminal